MEKLNKVLLGIQTNGNVKFPIRENEDFLNTSLEELNLDNRSYNALKRAKITTIKSIIENMETLYKVRGLGVKSVSRILYSICAYQYSTLNEKAKQKYLTRIVELNTAPVEQIEE